MSEATWARPAPTTCVLVRNPDAVHHTECPGQNLTEVTWARANLSYADLHGANLTGAHLRLANLDHANLVCRPHERLPVLGHLEVCGFLVRDLLSYPDLGHGGEQFGLPKAAIRARCRVEQSCERESRSLVTVSRDRPTGSQLSL
jgi:Pentapeptide repeats (8 copies)